MDLFLSQFKHASSLTLIHIVIKNFITRLNPDKWFSICRDQRVLACVAYTFAISCVAMGHEAWCSVHAKHGLEAFWSRPCHAATSHPLRATHFCYPQPPPPQETSGLLTSPSHMFWSCLRRGEEDYTEGQTTFTPICHDVIACLLGETRSVLHP